MNATARALILSSLSLAACGDAVDPTPTPTPPSPLARCADPGVAVSTAWQVDNIHAPITAVAATGATVVVGSDDGAVKLWHLAAGGAAEARPGYGTPLRDGGAAITGLAATADGVVVAVDAASTADAWHLDGTPRGAALAITDGAPLFAATDRTGRFLATGGSRFDRLQLVDLSAETPPADLQAGLWQTAAAAFTDAQLVTVGHWYSCHGLSVRDRANPEVPMVWDTCQGAGGDRQQGWFRAVAISADGATAITVGDGLLARFALDDLAAGPTAIAATEQQLTRVVWLESDRQLLTLGTVGDAAQLTWWNADDLTVLRTEPVAAGADLVVEPAAGIAVVVSTAGILTGLVCGG